MTLTVADFDNAKLDLITVSEVANVGYVLPTTTNRNGDVIKTLTGQLAELGYIPPVTYAGSISFLVADNTKTIDRSGIIYAPLPSELPFTTSGTWVADDETKFFVIQSSGAITTLQADVVTLQADVLAIETELDGELPIRNASSVGGTAVALTAAFTPAIASLTDKLVVAARFATANTGSALTLQLDATAAKSVEKATGLLVANDILTTQVALLQYNLADDKFYLLTPAQGSSPDQPLTASFTKTVGAGGDYATLNLAIEAMSQSYYQTYKSAGLKITLQLLSGFVMAEQILAKDVDLSFITITSVDATVTVTRSSITTIVGTRYPVFSAENAKLPVIQTKFNMDLTGTSTNRCGVFINKNSDAQFASGSSYGFTGAPIGVVVAENSRFFAYENIFTSIDNGVLVVNGTASIEGCSLSASIGLQVQCGYVFADNIESISCSYAAIALSDGANIKIENADCTLAGTYGLLITTGSKAAITGTNFRKNGASNQASDINCTTGSIVSYGTALGGTTPATKNAVTAAGIIFG